MNGAWLIPVGREIRVAFLALSCFLVAGQTAPARPTRDATRLPTGSQAPPIGVTLTFVKNFFDDQTTNQLKGASSQKEGINPVYGGENLPQSRKPPMISGGLPPLSPKIVRLGTLRFNYRDKDQDTFLSPEEWPEGKAIWEEVDRDRDGQVSFAEFLDWMGRFAAGRRIRLRLPSAVLAEAAESSSLQPGATSALGEGVMESDRRRVDLVPPIGSADGRARSVLAKPSSPHSRFYVPPERLPAGLPRWFFTLDANGDGQITVAEFLADGGPSRLQEFELYDRNGDGVLTPDEVLAGPRISPKQEKAEDTTPEGTGSQTPRGGQ